MHIAFFSDQHPATLGGLQTSLGLQRKHLEQRGHQITTCAPRSRRLPSIQYSRPDDIALGSAQIGEHSFSLAGIRFDETIDRAFLQRPPVDCVHVQGDVWGAWNGYRYAMRHNLPLVHTMHTNIEVGLPAILPLPRVVFRLLYTAQRRYLGARDVRSIADYTRAFAKRADLIIAPSRHFAHKLHQYGIDEEIHVMPTGVDDTLVEMIRTKPWNPQSKPLLVWPGRISPEKRLVDVLCALARSGVEADLDVYGAGSDLARARQVVHDQGLTAQVRFHGAVSHDATLWAMRAADAVLQSSVGYETQGLTAYEAVSLGTPVILRDRSIVKDLPPHLLFVAEDASIDALASAIKGFDHERKVRRLRREHTDQFLQSRLSGQAEELYVKAIAQHAEQAWRGSMRSRHVA